jgi:histone acetyltransferase (RNA polymerase elongator complex component)
MRPFVIPVFITHHGCPHRCIFCDQHVIAGRDPNSGEVSQAEVAAIIEEWLGWPRKYPEAPVQVAFYGGSFTGLPKERQLLLLAGVAPYMKAGRVHKIRLSTRPDYIDAGTVSFLKSNKVGCVELGVQSMSPEVLAASGRHYAPASVVEAVRLLREAGMTTGIQLMVGLPGETRDSLMRSTLQVAALCPDFVRIYPTLVIRNTGLHRLFLENKYRPLSLQQAVALTCRIKEIFDQHRIRIVRTGLQPSRSLEEKVAAGPYHPAFGELVASRLLYKKARRLLRPAADSTVRRLSIASADLSAFRGPGNINMKKLEALGFLRNLELTCDPLQKRQTVVLKEGAGQRAQGLRVTAPKIKN